MLVKVALFDFDNTLCQGDSIHRLLVYYVKKHPLSIFHFLKLPIAYILYLLHIISFEKVKSTILFPLNKLSEEELKIFYNNEVKPHYYKNVVNELKEKKEAGYVVVLCTASSESYMKYNDLPIDVLIGTKTNKSHIIGKNCKNKHKVTLINEYLEKNNYQIDYENSYAYSDSASDMPMLEMVKNRIRIELKSGIMKKW
jgi:HAD superfamily hydrolase (TIGR01490 family)